MRLNIVKSKNAEQLYVIKSFRDSNGKSTTKIVEKLGTLAELSKIHDDPIAWAKEYIAKLNRQEEAKRLPVNVKFYESERIVKDEQRIYEGGYLFLQKLYYELRLDYICKKISEKYRFEYNLNEIMSRLVYDRILNHGSKLGAFEYSGKLLEKPSFQLQDIYRALDVIAEESGYIQSQLYKFSKNLGKRNDRILYYDCTNYYFEIEKERGMCKYGVSKEHRPNPIVQMGLFMDGDGIPLAFCLNDGNTNEQKTLKPLEKQIIEDFGHSKFIVCTDSGLSSAENRKFNNTSNRAFITTQSIKKMKGFQKEWALSPNGWHLSGENKLFNISEILSDEKKSSVYYNRVFYKEEWFNENGIEQRVIVTFSIKYLNYTRSIRNEQIARAEKAIKSDSKTDRTRQTDFKRFIVKTSVTDAGELAEKDVYSLDEKKIHEEEQFDGFYAVATDLEDPVDTIVEINKGRWEIEESFRIMKSEFQARPVFLKKDNRILAHFTTCFIALTVFRYLEKRLQCKYSCGKIIDGLNSMRFLRLPDAGYIPAYTRNNFTDDLHSAFGFHTDYQIMTPATMRKIISSSKQKQ